jgi:hypothetical protein
MWARSIETLIAALLLTGCAALQSVAPADRAAGYGAEAKAVNALCKAYRFDRASGLVNDVPEMSKVCASKP